MQPFLESSHRADSGGGLRRPSKRVDIDHGQQSRARSERCRRRHTPARARQSLWAARVREKRAAVGVAHQDFLKNIYYINIMKDGQSCILFIGANQRELKSPAPMSISVFFEGAGTFSVGRFSKLGGREISPNVLTNQWLYLGMSHLQECEFHLQSKNVLLFIVGLQYPSLRHLQLAVRWNPAAESASLLFPRNLRLKRSCLLRLHGRR